MLEAINNLESLVVKLLKHPATFTSVLIVAVLEILLTIVTGSSMPKLASMSDQVAWEIAQLRLIYAPAVVALYVLSTIYVVYLAGLSPISHGEKRYRPPKRKGSMLSAGLFAFVFGFFEAEATITADKDDKSTIAYESPAAIVLAAIIALAIASVAFTLVPVAFNFTLALSVLERSFAVFGITAAVLALLSLVSFRLVRNPFAFAPLLLAWYLIVEYQVTKLSFEHSEWYFLNDLYFWNLVNPILKTPVMGSMEPPQVYVLTGYALLAITVLLILIRLFHGTGRGRVN